MLVDLHNIEDLLSLAYMESLIRNNKKMMNNVNEFIKIVIESCTGESQSGLIWFSEMISNNEFRKGPYTRTSHSSFVSSEYHNLEYQGKLVKNTSYGIISLNYDLLIENSLEKIANDVGYYYTIGNEENDIKKYYMPTKKIDDIGVPFAKLHGSIDKTIVPPTWNKNINKSIMDDWILASKLLSEATHIVFLGYSLPSTDNYVKYLLASSLNNNERLKKITVITKDSDGMTRKRYEPLFSSRMFFHNIDIINFFASVKNTENGIDFDQYDEYLTEYVKEKA